MNTFCLFGSSTKFVNCPYGKGLVMPLKIGKFIFVIIKTWNTKTRNVFSYYYSQGD